MRRLLLTCAVIAISLALLPAGTSEAEGGEVGQPKPTGEVVGGTPAIMIAVDGDGQTIARRTYRSSGGGPTWTCHYFAVKLVEGTTPDIGIDVAKGPIIPELDQLVALTCFVGGNQVHQEIFPFDPAAPFGTVNVAADAALLARELLPLPDPDVRTSPPVGRPQLVGVTTWFRVDTAWQTFSATATLGGVSATVTATPVQVVWDPGDGTAPITCDGPGNAFDPARPGTVSDCAHTYLRRTAADHALTATLTYDVAWTATDGSADVLDPVTRSTTVAVAVNEAQALVR